MPAMPPWIQALLALIALVVLAPAVAWLAKRSGRKARGGLMLACLMLGFGDAFDPPAKHMIEATDGEEKEAPAPGEPPLAS